MTNKVGCCGFTISQQEYFKTFKVIEIQQTFYQLPQLKTAEKWRQLAPQDFEFTLKAWQLITHEAYSPTYQRLKEKIDPSRLGKYGSFKPTEEVKSAWDRTAAFARLLQAKVIVFQCPPSFRPYPKNIANLRIFFEQVERHNFQFAWEPRGDWPAETILHLCTDLHLIHCVDPFKNRPLYGDFQYFRLHGMNGYNYQYSDIELEQVRDWAKIKPTYVMFNNTMMKEDALRYIQLTKGRS